jgi:hypothetical protein
MVNYLHAWNNKQGSAANNQVFCGAMKKPVLVDIQKQQS